MPRGRKSAAAKLKEEAGEEVKEEAAVEEEMEESQETVEESQETVEESKETVEVKAEVDSEANGTEADGTEDVQKEKPVEEKPKVIEEPVRKNLMKGDTHVFYNMNHALKMVLIKPFKPEMLDENQLIQWMKRAKSVKYNLSPGGEGEAVLYFSSVAKGDGAYLELKTTFDDDVKVCHPTAQPYLQANKFWLNLYSFSTIANSPVNLQAIDPDELFDRQIILENVPDSVTEEDLVDKFPEVANVICYPHTQNFVGMKMLEFLEPEEAISFKKDHKDLEIEGEKISVNIYSDRVKNWRGDGHPRDQVKGVELSDDDRIEKCKRIFELQEQKDGLLNRDDLFGDEKILEYHIIQKEIKPIIDEVKVDTNRRRVDGQRKFPEPDEHKSPYTKFAETKDFVRNKRFMQGGSGGDRSGYKRSYGDRDGGSSNKRFHSYGGSGGGGGYQGGNSRNYMQGGGMGGSGNYGMGGGNMYGGGMGGGGGGMGVNRGMGGMGNMNRGAAGGGNINDLLRGLSNALSNSVSQMNRGNRY